MTADAPWTRDGQPPILQVDTSVHPTEVSTSQEPLVPNAKIVSSPVIMMGKPVVADTRITVELILEKLGAGESIEQILAAHPRLSADAIDAAVRFQSLAASTGKEHQL